MARRLMLAGVCVWIATACNIESHEGDINECSSAGEAGASGDSGLGGGAGSSSSGGSAGTSGSASSGGSAGAAGAGSAGGSAGATGGSAGVSGSGGGPLLCEEIVVEAECVDRVDCEPFYAGVDCSCGPDCTCVGGEPGCICAGFEFFECQTSNQI